MLPSLRDSSRLDGDAGAEGAEGRRWFPAANGSAACEFRFDTCQTERQKTNGFLVCFAVISDYDYDHKLIIQSKLK